MIDNAIAQINQPQHFETAFIEPDRLYQLAGNLHRYQGACDTAIPYYLEAEKRRPQTLLTMRGLAICYEQTGLDDEAEKLFLAVLQRVPDDALTLNYLGYWWADDGRHLDEAIALIKKAVALQPASGFYADSLGWVYYRLGRMDDAIEWLERAIQLAPTDAIISDHLADAYWAVGRHLEARYKWQHALDLGLADQERDATRQKLSDATTAGTKSTQ
jgi:tetratricopeptide (TPR) repeat protein